MKKKLMSLFLAAVLAVGSFSWSVSVSASELNSTEMIEDNASLLDADGRYIDPADDPEPYDAPDELTDGGSCTISEQVLLDSYSTDYPNTYTNTGNQAVDIAAIAATQVGYAETGTNHTKYNYWYYGADTSAAWCAIFISWCANQAGISTSIIAKNAVASGYSLTNMAKNQYGCPAYAFAATSARVGDIAYISTDGDGTSNHVGLVVGMDDTYIYTVEGNYSDQCANVRYLVSTGYRALNASVSTTAHIVFYARPNYTGGSIPTPTDPTDPAETEEDKDETGTYKITISSLNVRAAANANSSTSVLGAVYSGDIIEVLDTVSGTAKDGTACSWGMIDYNGKTGWICLKSGYVSKLNTQINRLSGSTRYTTAIETANQLLTLNGTSSFSAVVIASADNYPDALAGSTLAAKYNAPILLAGKSSTGNTATINYIEQCLKPGGTVYILGGTSAVPSSVETSLKSAGFSITRLSGSTRYDTNLKVISACGISSGNVAFVVNGYNNFADALSIAAVAAVKGAPIYLSSSSGLSTAQLSSLVSLAPSKVYVIGGTSAVPSTVDTQLKNKGLTSSRIYGSDRYKTAASVARTFGLTTSGKAVIASGTSFPDGLVSGVLAAELNSPLLLVSSSNTAEAASFCSTYNVSTLYIMGGTSTISDKMVTKLID